MGVRGWHAVAATPGPRPNTLTVDLSHLPAGASVAAVRYAAGSGGYNSSSGRYAVRGLGSSRVCCGPKVDTALQPCGPERCPIKASGPGSLPAAPFFAAVSKDSGRCSCFAPQSCGGAPATSMATLTASGSHEPPRLQPHDDTAVRASHSAPPRASAPVQLSGMVK